MRWAGIEVEVLRVPAADSGIVHGHVQQSEDARCAHFAHLGGDDVGNGDGVPVAGGRGCAGAVGPLVHGGKLIAGEVLYGGLDLQGFRRHLCGGGGGRRRWALVEDVRRQHHPSFDLAENGEHGRPGRTVLTDPGNLSAGFGGICESLPDDGVSTGGLHAVGGGAGAEDSGDGFTQRNPGSDVRRGGAAGKKSGLLLIGGMLIDFYGIGGEKHFEQDLVDGGFNRVFRRVRRDGAVGHRALDRRIVFERRGAVVLEFIEPGDLQRFELRNRNVAVGPGRIGRIAERKLGIGKRIRSRGDAIAAVRIGRWRKILARAKFAHDFVPAKDTARAPIGDGGLLIGGDRGLGRLDGSELCKVQGVCLRGRRGQGNLRRAGEDDHLPGTGVGVRGCRRERNQRFGGGDAFPTAKQSGTEQQRCGQQEAM